MLFQTIWQKYLRSETDSNNFVESLVTLAESAKGPQQKALIADAAAVLGQYNACSNLVASFNMVRGCREVPRSKLAVGVLLNALRQYFSVEGGPSLTYAEQVTNP
jgi:hypothetical protein